MTVMPVSLACPVHFFVRVINMDLIWVACRCGLHRIDHSWCIFACDINFFGVLRRVRKDASYFFILFLDYVRYFGIGCTSSCDWN